MMNKFKDYVNKQLKIYEIFTYADNKAIPYFTKQKFVEINNLEPIQKYLKEYNEATPMITKLIK